MIFHSYLLYRTTAGTAVGCRQRRLDLFLALLDALPTKKPGFLLFLWSTAKDYRQKPGFCHRGVSRGWEKHCQVANAFCRDKSAEIVWFIYGGVGADLGWVPA